MLIALLGIVLVPFVLLGFHYRRKLSSRWRVVFLGIMLTAIVCLSLKLFLTMRSQIAAPPEWDFRWFWVYGRVATQGLNFCDTENAQRLAQAFNPSPEFIEQLDFPYLPPTIFLFLWLGWFDIQTSYFLWYALHSIILALDIILLRHIFLEKSGLMGLAVVAVLVLASPGTASTVWFGQTNFLVLLLLLLFWCDRDRNQLSTGIWLALGILTKPLLGGLLLYVLLRRHWLTLIGFITTLSAASLLTIAVFGLQPFFSYFSRFSTTRVSYTYTEAVNQSLLATILRQTHYDFSHVSPFSQPAFIALSLIIFGVTSWLIYKLSTYHSDWALAVALTMSLLLYPATLSHYSILLVVPTLLLWNYQSKLLVGAWGVAVFSLLQYSLTKKSAFGAFALTWLILSGIAIWFLFSPQRSDLRIESNAK